MPTFNPSSSNSSPQPTSFTCVDDSPLPTHPTYAAAFHCIGSACDDPCCSEWDIPLDKSTYELYQHLPSPTHRQLVSQFVILNQPPQPDPLYARIQRNPSGSCPFFTPDHLCSIHNDYGPQLLSAACSIYPRSLSLVHQQLEGALSLSCPEAARNVLLTPGFFRHTPNLHSGDFRTDNVYHLAHDNAAKPPHAFLSLRNTVLHILLDRSHPLATRLLLIGHLCQHLDAHLASTTPSSALAEIDRLPSHPSLRLETIYGLTSILMQNHPSPRFQTTFLAFVNGISTPAGASPQSDIANFRRAEIDHYAPFFNASPYLLENYLVNYIFQNLFPYGRSGSDFFTPQSLFTEYLQMTTQFAWLNGLLIGAAGHHQRTFSTEHVVHIVQSFSRAVEHYPRILTAMLTYINSRNLNSLAGMAILLKS